MRNNIERFYDLFVGNPDNFIIWDEHWKRNNLPISKNILHKHFNKEIAIGSYPIYEKNGETYCRWICIDIDSHKFLSQREIDKIYEEYDEEEANQIIGKIEEEYKDQVDEETKNFQKNFIRYLYPNSKLYLDISLKNLLIEDSVGGFHVWIILKKDTLLEDVGKFVYKYRPVLNDLSSVFWKGEKPEFYPKQYTTEHLDKGLGNAVRLPLGRNFGKNGDCKIIYGDIEKINPTDLTPLIKDVEIDVKELNGDDGRCENLIEYESKGVDLDLHFWLEFPIRPCFKKIIRGEIKPHGNHGHKMRMALVHECRYYKMPEEMIIKCFENQSDFKTEKTLKQIRSVIKSTKLRDGRYSCEKIMEIGYCKPDKECIEIWK